MTKKTPDNITLNCPVPISRYSQILLAHGGGGRLTHQLIESLMIPAFRNEALEARGDGAVVAFGNQKLAFTTDSFVIQPLFFPGGDIGSLSIHGTVNDLAMCGAKPLYLSAAFILEEGLPIEILQKVVSSMSEAAKAAGVTVVTGDTKVVNRGKGDGIFITMSGVGTLYRDPAPSPARVQPNDVIVLNGDIGRHGVATMAAREHLSFEREVLSDSAALNGMVEDLFKAGIDPHCLRDLTRGGLATSLIEIAETAKLAIDIDEKAIPVIEPVKGACEMLGFDPLYVANEGRMVAFVREKDADQTISLMRVRPEGRDARVIGQVRKGGNASVTLRSTLGADRLLEMFSGEQLPRIC